jgi:DNA-binding NarL/FixJ family response regulator
MSNCEQNPAASDSTPEARMATNPVLLCIHRDAARMRVLQENGYELLTAATGHEGLGLFGSQPVDAVVLEYNLGLLDGSVIASEIKQVRPNMPVVMLAEPTELPAGALQAVDALVPRSDPPHFLWAAVHFALNVRRVGSCRETVVQIPTKRRYPRESRSRGRRRGSASCVADEMIAAFDGIVQF